MFTVMMATYSYYQVVERLGALSLPVEEEEESEAENRRVG